MLLSAVLHTYSLRYLLPAALMLGAAPPYLLAWGCWRALSTMLPERLYRRGDDQLYTVYQSMVLFFFQHYTGVQMYLVVFPEGTRYNPEIPKVITDSQAFSMKEGLPVLKHVLTPRVKATHVAIDAMQDYLDAVYDITVAYEGTTDQAGQRKEAPSMTEFLCKECPRIHIFVERVDLRDIPKEQIFMRRWLHERFENKDKLLTEFYEAADPERRNMFPGNGHHTKLSLKRTVPSLILLTGLTAGMLCTETGRKVYVGTWIYGTLLGCLWVSISA
ncbi:hypothetical protein FKM82_011154 [Ascaphus truei]